MFMRLPDGRGEHVVEARGSQDVGDLVGVGHDRGGPAGKDGPGEFGDAGHGAFDVKVGVDKSRGDVAPAEIDGVFGRPIADGGDPPADDGHAARGDAAGKDIDDPGVGEQQVDRGIPPGRGDQVVEVHWQSPWHWVALIFSAIRRARSRTSSSFRQSRDRSRTRTFPATITWRTSAPETA